MDSFIGVASGDVRFRSSTGPTVNRSAWNWSSGQWVVNPVCASPSRFFNLHFHQRDLSTRPSLEGDRMNAERLGLIIRAIRDDMQKTDIVTKLKALLDALTNYIGGPNEQLQGQITNTRNQLSEAIKQSEFSNFPRTWWNTLEELGVDDLLGEGLGQTIDEIFKRNQITPDVAKKEIEAIYQFLTGYTGAFKQVLVGYAYLEIEEKRLEEGEAELSILMPTGAFDNELKRFAAEIKFFDQAIKFFSEVKTGSRERPHFKQLSSSDPTLFVEIGVLTLTGVLWVGNQILDLMSKTEGLRKVKHEAEKAGAETRITKMIEEQIKKEIDAGLVAVNDTLIKQYTGAKERKKELSNEGQKMLQGLATRLDNGYQIDGDVGEVEPEELEEGQKPSNEHAKKLKLVQEVKELAQQIRYIDLPDEPVLHLPKPEEEDDEDGGKEEGA